MNLACAVSARAAGGAMAIPPTQPAAETQKTPLRAHRPMVFKGRVGENGEESRGRLPSQPVVFMKQPENRVSASSLGAGTLRPQHNLWRPYPRPGSSPCPWRRVRTRSRRSNCGAMPRASNTIVRCVRPGRGYPRTVPHRRWRDFPKSAVTTNARSLRLFAWGYVPRQTFLTRPDPP
jgi:hypothetical protein